MVDPAGGLVGIGYQGREAPDLIAELRADAVTTVVDVRLNPVSRRYGFAKTRLADALAAAGIGYLHLRDLGNPRENRAGFADLTGHQGGAARERYARLLREPAARAALGRVAGLSAIERVAVLCFEADGATCHRAQVIEAVSGMLAWDDQNSASLAASAVGG